MPFRQLFSLLLRQRYTPDDDAAAFFATLIWLLPLRYADAAICRAAY